MNIYLASPFFNIEEIKNLSLAEEILRGKGLEVYSPREHEDRDQPRTAGWAAETFEKDITAIKEADMVVMLYYGNYSDSGTAWECGYAYGLDKPCIVVHLEEDSNLMIHEGSWSNLIGLHDLKLYDFSTIPRFPYKGKMF